MSGLEFILYEVAKKGFLRALWVGTWMKWGNQPFSVQQPWAGANVECPHDSGRLVGQECRCNERKGHRSERQTMARTHRASHLLESLPGYNINTLSRACLKWNSLHFLSLLNFSSLFISLLSRRNHHPYGHQARTVMAALCSSLFFIPLL